MTQNLPRKSGLEGASRMSFQTEFLSAAVYPLPSARTSRDLFTPSPCEYSARWYIIKEPLFESISNDIKDTIGYKCSSNNTKQEIKNNERADRSVPRFTSPWDTIWSGTRPTV